MNDRPSSRDNTAQMASDSYLLAVDDKSFLLRDELRAIRFALEYEKAELALRQAGIRSTVVVFGSARCPSPEAAEAMLQAANGNTLTPFQVVRQLERTADDLGPRGRDDRSGWGVVNIARALTTPVPPDDPGEVNDDIRYLAGATDLAVRAGAPLTVEGDVDAADDPDDVYPVQVHRGQRVRVVLTSDTGSQSLYVWGPATRTVSRRAGNYRRNVLGLAQRPGHRQVLVLRPARSGRIFVDVAARRGATSYRLRVTVSP